MRGDALPFCLSSHNMSRSTRYFVRRTVVQGLEQSQECWGIAGVALDHYNVAHKHKWGDMKGLKTSESIDEAVTGACISATVVRRGVAGGRSSRGVKGPSLQQQQQPHYVSAADSSVWKMELNAFTSPHLLFGLSRGCAVVHFRCHPHLKKQRITLHESTSTHFVRETRYGSWWKTGSGSAGVANQKKRRAVKTNLDEFLAFPGNSLIVSGRRGAFLHRHANHCQAYLWLKLLTNVAY
ncbi:hypothetical protein J6590_037763 [Homalodisca vitripennis]|nr:hypothetical protein J6590_037763 [Homalodisca vitripennis]